MENFMLLNQQVFGGEGMGGPFYYRAGLADRHEKPG